MSYEHNVGHFERDHPEWSLHVGADGFGYRAILRANPRRIVSGSDLDELAAVILLTDTLNTDNWHPAG
jgi:hypothetical protein